MAKPPPLPNQQKKIGCFAGCFAVVVIGFTAFVALGIASSVSSEKQWQQKRGSVIQAVQGALDQNDYQQALAIAAPYKTRRDAELDVLVMKAYDQQRAEAEARRQETIVKLIAEIRTSQEPERKEKLERLRNLAPENEEFATEFAALREEARLRAEEAEAAKEAERKSEDARNQIAKQERFRQAMEAKLAEFKWKYQTVTDALTSKPAYHARVSSINRVNFGFPYQGEQRGELVLRTHPQYGKDLFVRVDRGQMLVSSFQESNVKVVFDQGSPITYRVSAPADHSNTTAFIRDYHGFVERMLKAKKVKISVPFYQQGEVVFEFNVMDFDADRYLGKTASEP